MPTYDYKCTKCGHKFELFQTMSAEPIEKCPACGGKVKRLIGAGAGPLFKGSGFYQTDYKNPPKTTTKKDEPKKGDTKNDSDPKDTKPKG
jgi:putative FmdB family regulatory protein